MAPIHIFSQKIERKMAEGRNNEVLESPLFDFVKRGWLKWSQSIISVQATEEDFLLYLVWVYVVTEKCTRFSLKSVPL
jgi:hypothetical protein